MFLCLCLCHSGPDGVLEVDLVSYRFLQLALPDYRLEEKTHAEPDGRQSRQLLRLLAYDSDFSW